MDNLITQTVRKKVQVKTFSNASLPDLTTDINDELIDLFDELADIMDVSIKESGGTFFGTIVYYGAYQHTPDEV